MALALVGGAALGAVFGELLSAIIEMKEKVVMFRDKMEQLEATLESLTPVIKQIESYNNVLNRPHKETARIIREMEKGKKLICKCSKIQPSDLFKKLRYHKKLGKLDKSLLRFLKVDMQAQIARDQKQTLLAVKQVYLLVKEVSLSINRDPHHLGSPPQFEVRIRMQEKLRVALLVSQAARQYIDRMSITSSSGGRRYQNTNIMSHSDTISTAPRIWEYDDDERNTDRLCHCCEGGNCRRIEWLDETSGGKQEEEFEKKISTQYRPLIMQPLHRLETENGIIAGGTEDFNSIVQSRNPLAQQNQRERGRITSRPSRNRERGTIAGGIDGFNSRNSQQNQR